MKPFEEGIRAFKAGNLDNPYGPDTTRYRDWNFGFNTAYFDQLKKVREWEKERNGRTGTTEKN